MVSMFLFTPESDFSFFFFPPDSLCIVQAFNVYLVILCEQVKSYLKCYQNKSFDICNFGCYCFCYFVVIGKFYLWYFTIILGGKDYKSHQYNNNNDDKEILMV